MQKRFHRFFGRNDRWHKYHKLYTNWGATVDPSRIPTYRNLFKMDYFYPSHMICRPTTAKTVRLYPL